MAVFAGSLRGDGLTKVHAALAALEDNQQLNSQPSRFDRPPHQCRSDQSGVTTRSQSPDLLTEDQRNRRERQDQLLRERYASAPYDQFLQQRLEEKERIIEADRNGTHCLRVGDSFSELAYDIVKQRWVEQGLWSDTWTPTAIGQWKHEVPLEIESDWETDTEASHPPQLSVFGNLFPSVPKPKSRRLKSLDTRRQIAERRVVREREREASRPYHQFIYQLSMERERIHNGTIGTEGKLADQINTIAYETVKNAWRKREIWNEKWGVIPGMSWKHEKPWDEAVAELGIELTPEREVSTISLPKAQPAQLLDQPATNKSLGKISWEHSCLLHMNGDTVWASHRQASVDPDANPATHNDTEPSALPPSSPHLEFNEPQSPPKRTPIVRPSKRKTSRKDDQLQSPTNEPLGPVHSSKISKPHAQKTLTRQQQSKLFREALHDEAILNASSDVAASKTPRRSPRIQLLHQNIDLKMEQKASPSRQRRKSVNSPQPKAPTKPRGVTKKRGAKNVPGKARKQNKGA